MLGEVGAVTVPVRVKLLKYGLFNDCGVKSWLDICISYKKLLVFMRETFIKLFLFQLFCFSFYSFFLEIKNKKPACASSAGVNKNNSLLESLYVLAAQISGARAGAENIQKALVFINPALHLCGVAAVALDRAINSANGFAKAEVADH